VYVPSGIVNVIELPVVLLRLPFNVTDQFVPGDNPISLNTVGYVAREREETEVSIDEAGGGSVTLVQPRAPLPRGETCEALGNPLKTARVPRQVMTNIVANATAIATLNLRVIYVRPPAVTRQNSVGVGKIQGVRAGQWIRPDPNRCGLRLWSPEKALRRSTWELGQVPANTSPFPQSDRLSTGGGGCVMPCPRERREIRRGSWMASPGNPEFLVELLGREELALALGADEEDHAGLEHLIRLCSHTGVFTTYPPELRFFLE